MKNLPNSILDLIGNTPLIPLRRLNPFKGVTILTKLESFNPGGSIKDRIALNMIESAEKRGELTKDRIVLEASSGNTGIGLALVCSVKGYRCLIAMSEAASLERRKIMKAYGAEILLTPARFGTDGAIEAVYKLFREHPEKYFLTDQFNNPDNWMTHYHFTASEIWEQTGGELDTVISTMGTTGTLMGLVRRFRELDPSIRIIGVEPFLGHSIQGLKNMKESYRPGIFDKKLPDEIVNCADEEAFETARRLAREEGIFAGMSSGAAVAAAIRQASVMDSGTIVTILPDGGERYLSTTLFSIPEEQSEPAGTALKFCNTATKKKEIFEPLQPGKAGIYSCGPTACEHMDLSMARRLISADLLKRTLQHLGYKTTHVMNITDMDDRTINAAIRSNRPLDELTEEYARSFMEDVAELKCLPADYYPRASRHVTDMIDTTEKLIAKGFAYESHSSVYFDVSKLPDYGRFSRIDLERIDVGRTVDLDDYDKDSPLDFTLFKRVNLDELKRGIGYNTPWGQARPGWHIECAVMAMKYLGDFFDIHTSGCNLIFPHHENEIAIARALTGKGLAKYWLHSELILVHGKKMAPGNQNVVTIKKLLSGGYSGRQIRFFLLRSHYRKPVTFSSKALKDACRGLSRIDAFRADVNSCLYLRPNEKPSKKVKKALCQMERHFFSCILDDLNTSAAFGTIFSFIRSMNPVIASGDVNSSDASAIISKFREFDTILGVLEFKRTRRKLSPEIVRLMEERERARQEKRFKDADDMRKRLLEMGIELIDTSKGARIRFTDHQGAPGK